ncbi:MAG: tyrosine-protein phosphatase [Bifidobacteriaceae bacterium]|jgi:protein-tyrosine phosphatase|nr:tyrosine-protein phosphatase [Bifidobacteriaceae bacterium]
MRARLIESPPPAAWADVPGAHNWRGIGGYPAGPGRFTRGGVLFRSAGLAELTAQGRRALADLGLRAVIDLRSPDEAAAAPSAIGGLGLEVHSMPLFDAAAPDSQVLAPARLEDIYWQLIELSGARLAAVIHQIATGPNPVVVHCTAGKDRTGVVVALALEAVGVERAATIADYAASEANLAGAWFDAVSARYARAGVDPSTLAPHLLASPASLMMAVLEHLDRAHGGAAAYLLANGLTPAALASLQDRLVEARDPAEAPTWRP